MRRRSLSSLERLSRLTRLIYEREAQAIVELKSLQDEIAESLTHTSACLDGESIAGALFPDVVVRKAGTLANRGKAIARDLDGQSSRTLEAKASEKNAASRLKKAIADYEKEMETLILDEIADGLAGG